MNPWCACASFVWVFFFPASFDKEPIQEGTGMGRTFDEGNILDFCTGGSQHHDDQDDHGEQTAHTTGLKHEHFLGTAHRGCNYAMNKICAFLHWGCGPARHIQLQWNARWMKQCWGKGMQDDWSSKAIYLPVNMQVISGRLGS